MESAKASVKKFIGKDGHHDTTIDETVAPSVQQETVNRTQHERGTTAIDREVHQDHYHTTEQPVQDREVLPEQHHHNLLPTQEKSYEHDDADKVQQRLMAEQSKYKDTQTRVEGEKTASVDPTVAGEHVHHHVHETVQPVIQKQTIEPHVVHTTQPIHEVHHNAAQHHSSTTLPAVSMDEFKKQGGSLSGRDAKRDMVDGCPPTAHHSGHDHHHSHQARDSGVEGMNVDKSLPDTPVDARSASTATGNSATATNGHKHPEPATYGNDMHLQNSESNGQQKASLMDKLNPKKDADQDGVAGFMK